MVYTGSIRKVNNLGLLLDAAKCVTDPRVKFLIWGDGDEREVLERRVRDAGLTNVVFKGRVEKKYIPSIVSRADANLMHGTPGPLFRFGVSPNKMFDYFAAGKPILMDFETKYNPVEQYQAGIILNSLSGEAAAQTLQRMAKWPEEEYARNCQNARRAAGDFDFKKLTDKLLNIIESLPERKS